MNSVKNHKLSLDQRLTVSTGEKGINNLHEILPKRDLIISTLEIPKPVLKVTDISLFKQKEEHKATRS